MSGVYIGDIPLGDALKAHKYFIALAQKQWSDFTLYEKKKKKKI